jgi:hypothetical protein
MPILAHHCIAWPSLPSHDLPCHAAPRLASPASPTHPDPLRRPAYPRQPIRATSRHAMHRRAMRFLPGRD